MFSQLHYDHLALLCWSLLIATAAGSTISLAVLFLHKLFKGRATRYSLFLGCQLSFIPLFVLALIFSKPFTATSIQFFEIEEPVSTQQVTTDQHIAVTQPQDSEPIQILQSAPPSDSPVLTKSANVLAVEDTKISETPAETIATPSEAPPTNIRITLRDTIQNYAPTVATCWLIGVILLSARLIISALGLWNLRRSSSSAESELAGLFSSVKKDIYKKHVHLLESTKVVSPMVISWIKPTILMPMGIMSRLPMDQVESLLIHELHHIRRYDFLWNVLQRVVETLFFFNPLIWILGKEVRQLREELCDQSVIKQTNAPSSYAQALVSLAESSSHSFALAAKSKDGHSLTRRLRSILTPSHLTSPISKLNSIVELGLVFLVALCCFLPVVADLNEDLDSESLPSFVEHTTPSGRILNPDGEPIAGARVILHYDRPDLNDGRSTIVEETVSDAQGYYQFSSKLTFRKMRRTDWEDAYAILATHPDWAVGWYYLRPPNIFGDTSNPNPSTLDLYLETPVTQDFTVKLYGKKDADGNTLDPTPIKGAKVYLYNLKSHKEKPSFYPENYDPRGFNILGGDLGLSSAITNENGQCTLTNLPSSKCIFQIVHPDISRSWQNQAYNNKVTKCFPKASISGVLTDESGQPIPNSIIHAKSPESRPGWYTKTDSEGRYHFPKLYGTGQNSYKGGRGKAEFKFSIYESEWMLTEEYSYTLEPEENATELNLTATKGIPFHVTVMTVDNKPYPYAPVSIENGSRSDRKFTDSKGRVSYQVTKGRVDCRVSPSIHDYHFQSPYDRSNYSVTRNVKPTDTKLSETLIIDPKPIIKLDGKLRFEDNITKFHGDVILYPITEKHFHIRSSLKTNRGSYTTDASDTNSFSIKIPSDIPYVALARTSDRKWVGSTLIRSGTEIPIINLQPTKPQLLTLYGENQQPLEEQTLRWGEYHQGNNLENIEVKTSKKGEISLPGLRPNQTYSIETIINKRSHSKKFKANPGQLLKISFGVKKQIAVVDQNNNDITLSEIIEAESIVDNSRSSLTQYSSLELQSGQLKMFESDYVEFTESPNVILHGIFRTIEGKIIECKALPKYPLTFRLTSDLTHQFIRPRITPLKKSTLDTAESFRAVIVDQNGIPIKGATCITGIRIDDYHLYNKYSSFKDFTKKRLELKEALMSKPRYASIASKEDGIVYIGDATGNYSFTIIEAPGYATRWITPEQITQSPIKIGMSKNNSCQGQLLKEDGKPAAFHPIVFTTPRGYLTGKETFQTRKLPIRLLAITDEQGRFNELLEAGNWRLQAVINDDIIVDHPFNLKENENLLLKPHYSPAAHLTLAVQDSYNKAPVAGLKANISVYTSPHSIESIPNKSNETDKNGVLYFKGLIPNAYNIYLNYKYSSSPEAKEYTSISSNEKLSPNNLSLTLQPGKNEHTLNLEKGMKISGKITASINTDLSQISISYNAIHSWVNNSNIYVRSDGTFSGYLPIKKHERIRICAYQGHNSDNKTLAPTFSDYFMAGKGKNYSLDLHMTTGGSITGKIVDRDGKPISKGSINYTHLGEKTEASGLAWASPDKEGRFTLHGISAGDIKLKLSVPLVNTESHMTTDVFTIKEGEVTDTGVITFTPEP